MQVDVGKRRFRIDLDKGEVLLFIPCDVMCAIGFAVVRRDFNFQVSRAFDDMLVGDDVTGRIDEETRAQTLQSLAHLTGRTR